MRSSKALVLVGAAALLAPAATAEQGRAAPDLRLGTQVAQAEPSTIESARSDNATAVAEPDWDPTDWDAIIKNLPGVGQPEGRMVSGASRSGGTDVTLYPLVPPTVAWTAAGQPIIYWYLAGEPPADAGVTFTLASRQLEDEVQVELAGVAKPGSKRPMRLVADGRSLSDVAKVVVGDSGKRVQLLRLSDHSFVRTLKRKFVGE